MTPEATLTIGKEAMELVMLLTTVLLLPGLIVGLIVAVFQAATQINEMTLSFIPKLLITFMVLIMAGPWIMKLMMNYTTRLIENIPGVIG